MKKNIKLRTWALYLALVMVLTSLVLVNAFANGETCDCGGTYENGFCSSCGGYQPAEKVGDYYEIGNAGQLYWFADCVSNNDSSANAKLTANITVNTGVLNADGYVNSGEFRYWNPINYYYGTFDGRYFTISGLYCNEDEYAGLFGYLYEGATVKNVGVLDSCFYGGGDGVGGVVGCNNYGTVQNCYNMAYVYGYSQDVGGIVGRNLGTVANCYNHGIIYGSEDVGGIVGQNEGAVRNCYSIGQVGADTSWYGGVIGYRNDGSINNCYYLNTAVSDGRDNGATAKTAEEFASGEVASLLGEAFGQLLGTDDYPVFRTDANTLYSCVLCPNKTDGYSNDPEQGGATDHTYEDGMCIYCGLGLPPAQDEDGYYIITTAGELYWFADYVNNKGHYDANAKLGNDITVNENVLDEDGYLNEGEFRAWTPIGSGQQHYDEYYDEELDEWVSNEWHEAYTGHFDGQGFTIYGLYFHEAGRNNVGLFGYTGSTAKVEKVNVADSYFYGRYYVGGIVGYNDYGTVENCSGSAYVRASYTCEYYEDEWGDWWEDYYYGDYTGGIVGYNYGTVKNCSNSGYVYGYTNVGGVVGYNVGTVGYCFNSGNIVGTGSDYAGDCAAGIAGYNRGTVENCYNWGSVGDDSAGGVVGDNYGTVKNCYNLGEVYGAGDNDVGSVVAYNEGVVENCYYLEGASEYDNEYGTPKTEEEFASGEVMLLLGEAFGQDLSKGEKWPTLGAPRYTMIVVFTNGEKVYYEDLAEAVNAAKEDAGCTLILLIDGFKGEALINAGTFNLEFRGKQMNSTLVVAENANITITSGKFTNITAQNGGKVTVNGENVTLSGVLKVEEGEMTIIKAAVSAETGLKLENITLNEILDRHSFARNEDGAVVTTLKKIRVIRPGASLDEATIVIDNVAYTGEEVTPVVVITIGGKTLVLDEDFAVVSLVNNKDLGINTAEVTIRANAPYTGEKTLKFSIVNCVTDFGAQIKALEERLAALEGQIGENLQEVIDAIRAELEALQSNYATIEALEAAIARIEELEDAIATLENRVTANETAIDEIRQELAQVQEDVMNALNSGNADLVNQIERMKAAINAAIAANGAADAQTKAELNALIQTAETTLKLAVDKVAADLEQAKLDVYAAILAGDTDLEQKIAALQTAMNVAKEVSDAADNALKAELDEAVEVWNAAIAQLQREVGDTKNKWNELAIIAITLAGVGVAGSVGLLIFVIIDKRKLVR